MAEGILGLGTGAASLNNKLIEKLKTAERRSTVEPLENNLKDWNTEKEKITEIISKANELLETIKSFDLFVAGGVTAFDQKTANASGKSVVFDAIDVSTLNKGTTNVTVTQLAKRDVFQSNAIKKDVKDRNIDKDNLLITLDDKTYTFDTTGKTYDELAKEINLNSNFTASVEQVGVDSYRLVIKSAESGKSNALKIAGGASDTLGYTTDGHANPDANIQKASNLKATVNGIEYNVSTNLIIVDGGLKITAIETGKSSISIQADTTKIEPLLQKFISKYNELMNMVDKELYSADSSIEDKSTLRSMMSGIKDKLFSSYGTNKSLNIFNFGFEISKNGLLSIDSTKFNEAVKNNIDGLKSLFLGVAEKEGLGTQLKTYLDDLDSFSGLLTKYEDTMNNRKENLEKAKTKAIKSLDSKYALLSLQFAAYGIMINKFEAQFSSLKLMINQSMAK